MAKGRFTYFFCTAHSRREGCEERYVLAERIEPEVEELYRDLPVTTQQRRKITHQLEAEIAARREDLARRAQHSVEELATLTSERERLLRAYFADAIPLSLFKQEQKRIDAEMTGLTENPAAAAAALEAVRDLVRIALDLMEVCPEAYKRSAAHVRRRYNREFFEAVHVRDRRVTGATRDGLFEALGSRGSNKTPLVANSEHWTNPF